MLATVPALAREHQLSAYDAAYLELALREGAAIATLLYLVLSRGIWGDRPPQKPSR